MIGLTEVKITFAVQPNNSFDDKQNLGGRLYKNHPICLSVRPSVCLSVLIMLEP